jgi:hypothetical protein
MIFSRPFGQELQRHGATQLGVFRLVDHAHTATAEFLDDAVMRDRLPVQTRKIGHWMRILMSCQATVNERRLLTRPLCHSRRSKFSDKPYLRCSQCLAAVTGKVKKGTISRATHRVRKVWTEFAHRDTATRDASAFLAVFLAEAIRNKHLPDRISMHHE